MNKTISTEQMIGYLQSFMDSFQEEKEKFGMDKHTTRKLDAMIACKEMVEALIQRPVNLGQNGKVTIG